MRARRGNASHVDKTLDERIFSCRKLVIQSLERTIHQRMFFDYIRDNKLGGQIAQFRVNSGDGIIKLTFNTPEQAINFYQGKSFNDSLLVRKFNIYFDLSASEAEVKKYFLRGINEVKIRKVFQKCRQYGIVRLNILYGYNKMKDTCILSYLRTQPLSNKEFTTLAAELQAMYIMLDHYRQKNGNKSQIKMDKSQLKMMDIEMEKDQEQMMEKEVEKLQEIAQLPNKIKEEITLITLITSYGRYQNDITQKDEKILLETQKFIGVPAKDIEISRFKIPTLDSKKNKALLVRDIQFSQTKTAFQKFAFTAQWLKAPLNMIEGMVYLYIKGKISTLILVRPEKYLVKSKEGRCTIFSRTEEKDKLVKLAELEYEQIEDFICQQEKLMVNFYKSTQIEVFGESFDYDPDDDW